MKAKLKKGGIKGLFLLHGEKIAIALVGALAVYFIYSSLSLPSLKEDYQAAKLQSVVNATNNAVEKSTWPDADSESAADVRVFKPIAKNARVPIKAEDYPIAQYQPRVIAPTQLRTDPEVLGAVDVMAIGMAGVLAFQDDNTRAEQERRRALEQEEDQQRQLEAQGQAEDASLEGQGRRRGRDQESNVLSGEFDPDHPTRRQINSVMGQTGGMQLQGGERLEKKCWATVVAKVPIREQLKRYQDAFQNARGSFDPARDFPRYMGFIVERSEIQNGKETAWQRVPLMDGQQGRQPIGPLVTDINVGKLNGIVAKEYAMTAMEPVDPRYIDYVLTLPLPPMVGREWGADATHPDIPLAINAPPEQPLEPEAEEPAEQQPAEGEEEMQFGATEGGQVPGGGFPMEGGMRQGYSQRPMMMRGEYGGEPGGGWGGGGRRQFAGGGMPSFAPQSGNRTDLPRGVDYWLVRFFDFTVQPGKKYKYRVQLVLADPNYGIPASLEMLDPSVRDRQAKEAQASKTKKARNYRLAAVSEASPAVGIPLDGNVRVATAKLPSGKQPYEEPSVKLWAETYEIDPAEGEALHVAKDRDFLRGSVVNLRDKMVYTHPNGQWKDTFDSHTIYTNITVLDIDGADRISRDKLAPARVLLMDAAGELSIRDEMDDSIAVLQLKSVFTEDRRRRGDEDEEMMGGPDGFRPPRGGRGRP